MIESLSSGLALLLDPATLLAMLLGTVFGMIRSFEDSLGDPRVLADGISQPLHSFSKFKSRFPRT